MGLQYNLCYCQSLLVCIWSVFYTGGSPAVSRGLEEYAMAVNDWQFCVADIRADNVRSVQDLGLRLQSGGESIELHTPVFAVYSWHCASLNEFPTKDGFEFCFVQLSALSIERVCSARLLSLCVGARCFFTGIFCSSSLSDWIWWPDFSSLSSPSTRGNSGRDS
jgi:hypothetical protein